MDVFPRKAILLHSGYSRILCWCPCKGAWSDAALPLVGDLGMRDSVVGDCSILLTSLCSKLVPKASGGIGRLEVLGDAW